MKVNSSFDNAQIWRKRMICLVKLPGQPE